MDPEYAKHYASKRAAIRQRLSEFKSLSEKDVFYELCFCLLTPQSKGRLCWERVLKLKEKNFLEKDFDIYGVVHGIRFHNQKIKRLHNAKRIFPRVFGKLKEEKNPTELREWLVENVDGFGYKEASHFLRNIGHRNLAILDRHILRHLSELKVIPGLPKTLTPKHYFNIEKRFQKYSSRQNVPMDELDLLFWSISAGEVFK